MSEEVIELRPKNITSLKNKLADIALNYYVETHPDGSDSFDTEKVQEVVNTLIIVLVSIMESTIEIMNNKLSKKRIYEMIMHKLQEDVEDLIMSNKSFLETYEQELNKHE